MQFWLSNPLQGQTLRQLQKLAANGKDVPMLRRIPAVHKSNRWVWDAFLTLSEKRARIGEVLQPIEMQAILAYAEYEGIRSSGDRKMLLNIIDKLDSMFRNAPPRR